MSPMHAGHDEDQGHAPLRPGPNQVPIASATAPSVMAGITRNWAIGPIRNAVTGEAAVSRLWANPKTRPCSLNGYDLLDDGLLGRLGHRSEGHVDEEAEGERQDLRADREDDASLIHSTMFASSSVRTGLAPRPRRATRIRRR